MKPRISIVIPHYAGDILLSCLSAVQSNSDGLPIEIFVVDDSVQPDGSVENARSAFPAIRVLRTKGGQGFGASCNTALREVSGSYVVLLNNDTRVAPGWLRPLIEQMEEDPTVAVCQPKILSLREPEKFDAGGGAGGQLDFLGYPFALGSLVHVIESDHGQYDRPADLVWAHGSALALRRSVIDQIGMFDEDFYMQAEEIDLCCRVLQANHRIRSVPASVVYHYHGWTFRRNSVRGHYLSHRNTIVVLLKNWPLAWLAVALPLRLIYEVLTMGYGLVWRRDVAQPAGIALALAWILLHPVAVVRRRRGIRGRTAEGVRTFRRRVYKGAIIWAYFFRGVRTSDQLRAAAINGPVG